VLAATSQLPKARMAGYVDYCFLYFLSQDSLEVGSFSITMEIIHEDFSFYPLFELF